MLPYLTIAGVQVSTYIISLGTGLVISLLFLLKRAKMLLLKEDQDTLLAICGPVIVTALFCAFLHNKFVSYSTWESFRSAFFHYTGIAFLGGLLGGMIAFCAAYLVFFRGKYPLREMLDLMTPSVIVGHLIGRIGCLLGGCCYGKPNACFGIHFAVGTPAFQEYGDIPLIPTQIMEIILLAVLLAAVSHTGKLKFPVYLLLYSAGRFVIEFFRGDMRGTGFGPLSPAQVICILLLILGIVDLSFRLQFLSRNKEEV